MFEKFTERARDVMGLSRREAQRVSSEFIGTEHLLVALLEEGEGVAAKVLKNLQVDLKRIRQVIEKLNPPSTSPTVTLGQLPFSPRVRQAIERAAEASTWHGAGVIDTEHLLIGLLEEEEGIAAQVLRNLGLKIDEVRDMVLEVIGAHPKPIPWSDRVRTVAQLSVAEAERMGLPTVEPEHVLLGLLAEGGPAAELLTRSGITAEAIRGIIPRL